jgi:hypothetical protein
MLISMCSCAPAYFRVDIFGILRVIAIDLVKIYNFQHVSHVSQKVFDLVSWNFTGIWLSMCSCAPGVSLVDLFCFVRFIALDLVKTVPLCCVICSLCAWVSINHLYRNNDQYTVKLCIWGFARGFFQFR